MIDLDFHFDIGFFIELVYFWLGNNIVVFSFYIGNVIKYGCAGDFIEYIKGEIMGLIINNVGLSLTKCMSSS